MAPHPIDIAAHLQREAERGTRYEMTLLGRTGKLLFTLGCAGVAVVIGCALCRDADDFLGWAAFCVLACLALLFGREALSGGWRITTTETGFIVRDGRLLHIGWEQVESWHWTQMSSDTEECLVVSLRPEAGGPKGVGLEISNLKPPKEQLLQTFRHHLPSREV